MTEEDNSPNSRSTTRRNGRSEGWSGFCGRASAWVPAQVSYVVAVRQCSVLFAVAFAVWMLSERPTRLRMTGTLGTLAGVVLIALYA